VLLRPKVLADVDVDAAAASRPDERDWPMAAWELAPAPVETAVCLLSLTLAVAPIESLELAFVPDLLAVTELLSEVEALTPAEVCASAAPIIKEQTRNVPAIEFFIESTSDMFLSRVLDLTSRSLRTVD
jgi:hypothetical protein